MTRGGDAATAQDDSMIDVMFIMPRKPTCSISLMGGLQLVSDTHAFNSTAVQAGMRAQSYFHAVHSFYDTVAQLEPMKNVRQLLFRHGLL